MASCRTCVGQGDRADITEYCAEFWEGGTLEDADTEAAYGLCRGQGIGLCGYSLRIKAGRKD